MKYRIGIDVGGTFTHAVAIESATQRLAGKVKVPTTHSSSQGVGQGIVESLKLLMKQLSMSASDISVVAHSTTQATNSLLEGDVEPVGIVSIGKGWMGKVTAYRARLGRVQLSPGKFLETRAIHLNRGKFSTDELQSQLDRFLASAQSYGISVIVVVAAFSVEDQSEEKALADYISSKGFKVTSTSEVAQLYGIRVRTRTTAINASIMPKMLEVTDHTEREIRNLGIQAPLMIMRSDGGIMSVTEMRKKPILTLLSGPAAGIAAALKYLNISDGIFLEVGGTSTDISAIKNGRAITRSASIGGNKTFLKTLDCRTLGIGGGSLPRVENSKVVDVGPRSAHIAGVKYGSFDSPRELKELKSSQIQPLKGDPSNYLIFKSDTQSIGFTPTCAANALDLIPDQDCAKAHSSFPGKWNDTLQLLGLFGLSSFAESILAICSQKVGQIVDHLLKDYRLEPLWTVLIGGGGGASAIVPHLAKTKNMKFEIAKDADVISAIGVALGMIREVVEKSILNPTKDDLYKLRQEAREKVLSQGADPDSIEVFIEVDTKKNIVRAEAQGSIEFSRANAKSKSLNSQEKLDRITQAFGETQTLQNFREVELEGFSAFSFDTTKIQWGGLSRKTQNYAALMDNRGVVRLKLRDAHLYQLSAHEVLSQLPKELEKNAVYGDGGATYPYAFIVTGGRLIDLSKLPSAEHYVGVIEMELKDIPDHAPAAILLSHQSQEEE